MGSGAEGAAQGAASRNRASRSWRRQEARRREAPPQIARGLGGVHDHPSVPWGRLLQLNDASHGLVHAAWLHELPPACAAVVCFGDSLSIPAAWWNSALSSANALGGGVAAAVPLLCCCSPTAQARARAWLESALESAPTSTATSRRMPIRFVDDVAHAEADGGDSASAAGRSAAGSAAAAAAAAVDALGALGVHGGGRAVAIVCEAHDDALLGADGASHTWALDAVLLLRLKVRAFRAAMRALPTVTPVVVVVAGARAYRLMAQPIECAELWRRRGPIGMAAGIDLRAFNVHAPRPTPLGALAVLDITPWRPALLELAPPQQVTTIDVCGGHGDADGGDGASGGEDHGTHAAQLVVACGGTCHAVLVWTEVSAGGHTERACDLCRRHAIVLLPRPTVVRAGGTVHVELRTSPPRAGDVRDVLRGCGVAWSAFVVDAHAVAQEMATATHGSGAESGAAEGYTSPSENDGGGGGDEDAKTKGAPAARPVLPPEASGDSQDSPAPLPVLVDLAEGELEIGTLLYDSDDE